MGHPWRARPGFETGQYDWYHVLGVVLAVLFGGSLLAYTIADAPLAAIDPAFYQHVGWYVTQGAVPYVDVWDINPPLTFGVAAALAVVAGGNLLVQHALGVVLTVAVVGGGVGLTGALAADVTGDRWAALAAALVVLVPAETYGLVPFGLRSQYFALLFGVLALVLVRRARPALAGASAAIGAGFWQPGAGVALLVVGMAAQRSGRDHALAAVAGGLAVAAAVVLPFVAVGAFVPMVVQTVGAPLAVQDPYTLLGRTYELALALGYGTLLLPVAVAGWGALVQERTRWWWIPAGGLVYGLQVYLVNFNGALDALLFLPFVALGVAAAVASLPGDRRRWAAAVLVLLVATGPAWNLAAPWPKESLETQYERVDADHVPSLVEARQSSPSMQTIYWEKRKPESCHYRLSFTELYWIEATDARLGERRCG